MVCRTSGLSTSSEPYMSPVDAWGHWSGFLPAYHSVLVSMPCSSASMPNATASRNPTEQRCAVTLTPCLCASSIAAPRSAREINVYALNHVTPSSAQYLTMRRASSGPDNGCIAPGPTPDPWRYGPVTTMFGPGSSSESICRLRLSSWYESTLPVVRMVVAP